jgi:outer membrane protein assembly factor BamB
VFATSDDGHLYALDVRTGKPIWKVAGSGKMYTHPLVLSDRVIVGDAGGWVRAFAAADGKELWKVQLAGAIRGGASADERNIYVASQGGEVAALTSAGKKVWRQIVRRPAWNHQGPDQPIEVYSPPIVDKDALYVPFARDTYYTDQPAVLALDKKSGKVKWRAKGPGDWGNVRSTPALVAGTLLWAEPYSGDVTALDTTTGRMAWRFTVGDCYFPAWASPAVAGDLAYVPRLDGTVQAMRASSGKLEWKMYLGDSSRAGVVSGSTSAPAQNQNCAWDVSGGYAIHAPAALSEDGVLFVGTDEGVLFAIGN